MEMDRQFKIKDTNFALPVIPPLEAFDICELLREAISRPQDLMILSEGAESPREAAKRIIPGLVMSISREHFKGIVNSMLKHVTFQNSDQPTPAPVAGLADTAFGDLDPFAIYEVIGRAVYVNFSEYLNNMLHRVGISPDALKKEAGNTPP